MRNETLVKGFTPGAAVAAYRIIKMGAVDNTVIQAEADEGGLGVSNHLGAAATDDTVDVVLGGIAEVEYGGNVTRGAWLTADANGKAIAADAAGEELIGKALVSGVAGDIGSCLIAPGIFAAAA